MLTMESRIDLHPEKQGIGMREELLFGGDDSIAVIAPHPDDECLCAAAALIMAPERTDVYVISDGSHGNLERSIEEEAVVRKRQFDAEMDYVKPRRHVWLGYEDTKLAEHFEAADEIDFTQYTKVFLPSNESPHPDHGACPYMCCETIMRQKALAELARHGSGPYCRHRCTIAPGLLKSHWGHGLGKALFATMLEAARSAGYEQAEASVDMLNEKSYGLCLRMGYEDCGFLPHAEKRPDGTYRDYHRLVKML